MIARLLDWLLHGSNDLTMPPSWLEDTARMRVYTAYTMRQLQQGSVVKDTAATARERFWQRIAAQQAAQLPANVARFKR